jgi:hypothetical protein
MGILSKSWDWKLSGVALGLIFLVTIFVVKPIGVSTQFVILDGIIWNSLSSELIVEKEDTKYGYESSNSYLNKGHAKYAKNVENPLNYSFVFVIAMLLGGFISSRLSKEDTSQLCDNSGLSTSKKYIFVFIGGILVLFGARLAGGCSSGHMMSGMIQTSISGYLFAISTFLAAIPLSILIYKNKKES